MSYKGIFNGLLMAALAVAAVSCDEIGEDERLVWTDPADFQFTNKVVLLEEFTGHRCPNCPSGAEVVHGLETWARGHVIPVSIHCGFYAEVINNTAFSTDFRTNAGNAYFNEFGPDAFPSAMVDRSFDEDMVYINSNYSTWQADVLERAIETSPVDLQLDVTRNDRNLSIDVTTAVYSTLGVGLSLQLWLVEDSIVGAQLAGNEIDYNYVHNHVLRDAINGTWGEEIGVPVAGSTVARNYNYTIGEACKPENCHVVAFLYETASRGNVIQAARW